MALVLVLFQLPLFVLLLAPLRSLGSSCCPSHLCRGGRDLGGWSLPLPLPPLQWSFPRGRGRCRPRRCRQPVSRACNPRHHNSPNHGHCSCAAGSSGRRSGSGDPSSADAPCRCAATRRAARPSASPSSLGKLHTKRVASPPGLPDAHWRVGLAFLSFSARMPVAPSGKEPDENLELFLLAQRQFLCETDRSLKLALLHCASGVRHFHLAKPILHQASCDAAPAPSKLRSTRSANRNCSLQPQNR